MDRLRLVGLDVWRIQCLLQMPTLDWSYLLLLLLWVLFLWEACYVASLDMRSMICIAFFGAGFI